MILYDSIIEKISEMTGKSKPAVYSYSSKKCWEESEEYELILQKEMAYELGGEGKPSANFTCVTTEEKYFDGDQVLVYGPDLKSIKKAVPYARITLLLTSDIENISKKKTNTEAVFRAIQSMDFVKYHVYPKGYMVRTSGMTNREQVRISKKAIKAGISFEKIGNTFIRHYKENKYVKNVKVIFITAEDARYDEITSSAKKVADITSSLSQILQGLPTECGSCGLREICDEVEGMKELHFGAKK